LQAGGGPAFTYTFAYNSTSGLLDSIIAPSVNNRTRKVALTRNGATGGVQTIKELLDSTYQVGFEFQPGSQLIYAARLDRRNARTSFAYEPSSPTIASFTTATGTGSDVVSHTFRTATAIGAAGTSSANLDTVYFRYDGPRPTAVGDTTLFWLDRFGAPVRILNALGQETRVARGDPRFPGLATETRGPGPKFFTAWASYDDRGNLRASTQIAPYDVPGVDATTTYAWDPKWDEVVRVTLPEGEVTNFGIDATTGNRKWQEDGRGITSHVDFAYYTDAPRYGLLKSVTVPGRSAAEPGTATSTYDYDASANLRLISGARREEHFARDSVGRVVFDSTKIDSISGRPGYWQIQQTDYDLADRTIRTFASGASAATGSDNASETVSAYNLEGGRDSVKVRSAGVNNPTIIVRRRFTYDLLGRVRTEGVEQDGHVGTWLYDENQYDEAGNVKTRIARTGAATTMTYDALNRLASRTMPSQSASNPLLGLTGAPANSQVDAAVKGAPYAYTAPADVATFSYDPATGVLLDANNAWAKVHRTYFANGQLKTETQRLRTWGGDTTDANYTHLYDLTFAYDRNGRRVSLRYPTAFGSLTAAYGYDPVTGELATVTDLQGKQIQFAYDYRGSLVQRLFPSPTGSGQVYTERFHFTDDGDLNLWAMRGPGSSRDSVQNQTFTFDARGKQLTLYDSLVTNGGQEAAVYDGLGQLMQSTSRVNGTYSTSVYTLDGIGNVLATTGSDATVFDGANSTGSSGSRGGYLYEPVTGRRTVSYDATSTGDTLTNHRPFITRYDAAGNAWWYGRFVFDQNLTQNERRSYYAANNVLVAADARTWDTPTTVNTALSFSRALEEYRYDALGRRVLVLATRACSGMIEHSGTLVPRVDCLTSTIRRTVWDGAAELGEIQMPAGTGVDIERDSLGTEVVNNSQQTPLNLYPFYGRVAYVYAPGGIDRPLAVTRFNYSTLQPAGTGSWQSTAAPTFTLYPIWNTHGQASRLITLSATLTCGLGNPGSVPSALCVRYDIGSEWLPYLGVSVPQGSWQGTLLTDKSDAAGTKYRRNRYYDPQSGRFTQEDPIGLAGGLNVYGFANGDPVNFSDPFGLCPMCVGAALGVAEGYGLSLLLGEEYSWKQAAVDAALGAAGVGLASKLKTFGKVGAKAVDRVIGHYPEYLQVAEATGAKAFNVSNLTYKIAGKTLNRRFLDKGIKEGAEFVLATAKSEIREGSILEGEVRYLTDHGYKWAADNMSLISR
jgi:RHS repeat-associated protein